MKIHQIEGYIQTIYLVEYPSKVLLLDGCAKADIPMLKDFFKNNLKRPMSDLKAVLVTHMHPDHAGAAHGLRKLCGCQIISSNEAHQWYAGISGLWFYIVDTLLMRIIIHKQKKPQKLICYNPYLSPDVKLNHEDYIPGFEDWQIFKMPGHTDRDLCAYHTQTGKIYVADLLIKLKHKWVQPFPINYPAKYKNSLRELIALKPTNILMAHGGEAAYDEQAIQQTLDMAPDRPRQIRTLLIPIIKHFLFGIRR